MTSTPVWQRMQEDMQLAGLAARTQEAYLGVVHRLADHAQKSPDLLTEADLCQYFLYLRTERKLSRSSLTIALCGIKFLFEHTLQRDWPTWRSFAHQLSTNCPPSSAKPKCMTCSSAFASRATASV